MGITPFKKSKAIKPEIIKDFNTIYENMKRRDINEPSDFSIEKIKQKAVKLFQEAQIAKDSETKIRLLENAISYDNTNEAIIKDYLNLLKNNDETEFKKQIDKYYYHISEKSYKELFGEDKKMSSIKLITELFNKFKSYETSDDLSKVELDFINKKKNNRIFLLF